jgi:hypothetical protein
MLAVGSKPGGPFKRVDKGTYTLADAPPATGGGTRKRDAKPPTQRRAAKPRTQKPQTSKRASCASSSARAAATELHASLGRAGPTLTEEVERPARAPRGCERGLRRVIYRVYYSVCAP